MSQLELNFNKILIKNELKFFITPLSEEEYLQLETNILADGCRDPLIIWEHESELILIDGHNRYSVCQKHNIDFDVELRYFKNINQVKDWMIDNQLGRRNLNPKQLSYFRGLKYERIKKKKGGYDYVRMKGEKGLSTSEKLSKVFNVSQNTIKRDAQFAKGLEIISKHNVELKNSILSGGVKINKGDIQLISENPHMKIMSVKDLKTKAVKIKQQKELEKEKEKELINNSNIIPIFSDKNDRLDILKGRILSTINKIIKENDISYFQKLDILVVNLKKEFSVDA